MKILIVDDEEAIRDSLGRRLSREGYEVVTAANGLDGLRNFHSEHPDLVILDIVIPEMDGLTVCQRIREVSDTPIIMLSAQAIEEDDIVEGLNAGADEYLMKPVRGNEFVARINAVMRRASMSASDSTTTYDDGYLSIDFQRRHVHVNNERVHLTPTEFKLLMVLVDNAGKVVPQRDLLEQVWGQEYVEDIYYPRVYISQLRRKIEPDQANPTYIQTEHRVGYRFEKQI
ncbi:MAG: response regulator transcription factor [Chloroflexi bacterium]|nr:response regulator transcription factor [Chloroflexota bacterium]